MHKILILNLCFLLSCFFFSCQTQKNEHTNTETPRDWEKINNQYAVCFSLEKNNDNYRLFIFNPKKDTLFRYLIYPKKDAVPHLKGYISIAYPIEKSISLSTKYAAFLTALDKTSKIIGLSGAEYAFNPQIHQQITDGKTQKLGINGVADVEKIIALNADVIFDYLPHGNSPVLDKMLNLNLPVLVATEYLETQPLGQAEWLKVYALLLGETEKSDKIFKEVTQNYHFWKDKASKITKPSVFCNIPYQDVWYMPSQANFAATFIQDAGGNYLWKDLRGSGSVALSIETVLEKAINADFWLNAGNFTSKKDLSALTPLVKNFAAVKNSQVFSYTQKITPAGGCDYFESGVVRPDLILKDLYLIFSKNAGDSLYFYRKLE